MTSDKEQLAIWNAIARKQKENPMLVAPSLSATASDMLEMLNRMQGEIDELERGLKLSGQVSSKAVEELNDAVKQLAAKDKLLTMAREAFVKLAGFDYSSTQKIAIAKETLTALEGKV